jgi:hypothetical protein
MNKKFTYLIIGIALLIAILLVISILYFCFRKKKTIPQIKNPDISSDNIEIDVRYQNTINTTYKATGPTPASNFSTYNSNLNDLNTFEKVFT